MRAKGADTTAGRSGMASVKDAEKYLNISRATVYGLMTNGSLQYVKIGKSRRIPWDSLDELISKNGSELSMVEEEIVRYGLTKREYMATQALAGILATLANNATESVYAYAAHKAVCFTDALMAELSKPQRKE